MSRSYKKPVIRGGQWLKDKYWSIVRSRHRTEMQSGVHPEDLSDPKTIVNDYDYCDYIVDNRPCTNKKDCWCLRELGYKKCTIK